jgi:cation:H+ antiporter
LGLASASPEFVTAISGVRHKAAGVSLGTLIGSNIANPLVAIGGGALLSTYSVPTPLVYWDLPMETMTAAALLVFLLLTGRRLGRAGGVYLIALYGLYIGVRVAFFAVD